MWDITSVRKTLWDDGSVSNGLIKIRKWVPPFDTFITHNLLIEVIESLELSRIYYTLLRCSFSPMLYVHEGVIQFNGLFHNPQIQVQDLSSSVECVFVTLATGPEGACPGCWGARSLAAGCGGEWERAASCEGSRANSRGEKHRDKDALLLSSSSPAGWKRAHCSFFVGQSKSLFSPWTYFRIVGYWLEDVSHVQEYEKLYNFWILFLSLMRPCTWTGCTLICFAL